MDSRTSPLPAIRPVIDAVREHAATSLASEPTNEIERKADVALGWIERAILTDDPLVALLYRFFALEALLGDKSSGLKGEQLAFRRATLSHAVTHPDRQQLVDWLRHSGGPRWERFVAKQTTAGAAEAPPD